MRPGAGGLAFSAALDLVLAMPLSWLPLISDHSRYGENARQTFRGTLLGFGAANLWFYLLGAAYGLAAGSGDALLTSALARAGGGLALLLVLINEVDNAFADIHSAAVSCGLILPRVQVGRIAAVAGILCTAITLSIPMARYQNFLGMIGSVFAPLFGVALTDHFVVRRRRADVAALADPRGPYGFTGGWHVSALLAWALGAAAYQAINQWLPNLGATLPALVVAGACHATWQALRHSGARPSSR